MTNPASGLDDVVHQRNRLGILAILVDAESVEFTFLRESLALTAGNLSRHLAVLADAGLVSVGKTSDRRTKTWVAITKAGRLAFEREVDLLREIVARRVRRIPTEDTPAGGSETREE